MIAPYKFKKPRKPSSPKVTNRVKAQNEDEVLSGFVQGWEASDIEERFSKGLSDHWAVERFSFRRHFFGPARNTPGAIEVDFMVFAGGNWWPVQVDGEYSHKGILKKQEDKQKDARLDQYFSKYGINRVQRIPDGIKYIAGILDTQDGANQVVEELFG